ncbi:hypothetical protein FCM35_KLT11929 [Carex littledalei]|uniref:Uncharacterized protein n=1 Tax=Carex littledalei TaxID=544730 RepID=A0A833QPC3_9POAL|nr:hypothetical protein FCM35_KLT11929 [Carex littledalei]
MFLFCQTKDRGRSSLVCETLFCFEQKVLIGGQLRFQVQKIMFILCSSWVFGYPWFGGFKPGSSGFLVYGLWWFDLVVGLRNRSSKNRHVGFGFRLIKQVFSVRWIFEGFSSIVSEYIDFFDSEANIDLLTLTSSWSFEIT